MAKKEIPDGLKVRAEVIALKAIAGEIEPEINIRAHHDHLGQRWEGDRTDLAGRLQDYIRGLFGKLRLKVNRGGGGKPREIFDAKLTYLRRSRVVNQPDTLPDYIFRKIAERALATLALGQPFSLRTGDAGKQQNIDGTDNVVTLVQPLRTVNKANEVVTVKAQLEHLFGQDGLVVHYGEPAYTKPKSITSNKGEDKQEVA